MSEKNEFPHDVCIRLNRICNLNCSFCLANQSCEGLSTEQIFFAINYLKSNGIKKARLAGGEPTLRSDFLEIVDFCQILGLKTIIYSNLTEIDQIFNELVKYPVSFTTSIHGNLEFHNQVTQKGAYESTIRNVKKLIKYGKEVNFHSVIMKENFKYAEQVVEKAIEIGVKKISFQTLIPRGKGKNLFKSGESETDIVNKIDLLYPLRNKYKDSINIKFINLYEKNYYILETDGCIYLQKPEETNDVLIRRIIN